MREFLKLSPALQKCSPTCVKMKKNGMLVVLDSDVDEEELELISKKLKKIHSRLGRKQATKKNSSLTSSPSSSPPESDAASTSSVLDDNPFPLKAQLVPQEKRLRKKRKTTATYEDGINANKSKVSRTGDEPPTEQQPGKHSTTDGQETAVLSPHAGPGRAAYPKAWYCVSSTHYAFSSGEDSEDDRRNGRERVTCRNTISGPDNRTKPYMAGKQSTSAYQDGQTKADSHSCEQNKTDSHSRGQMKDSGSNRCCGSKADRVTGVTAAAGLASSSLSTSCLTRCRSCAEYTPPQLSGWGNSDMKHYVAMDCEFVGVGPRKSSALGRCSIVDQKGEVLFDRFVQPSETITDYRTRWSGLRPKNIRRGIPFLVAQQQIAALIKDRVVVGHAVHNDFRVINISHPVHMIRDTASCKLLQQMANMPGNSCALRKLTAALLGRSIQKGEHCSVTDARASLDLFRLVQATWEPALQAKFQRKEARHSPGGQVKVTQGSGHGVKVTQEEPDLSSYLDDQYWPADMFADSL